MDPALRGRVALVTGASRGIGRAVAVTLAREGVQVALCARARDPLEETAAACGEHGVDTLVLPADLARPELTQGLVADTVARFGRLDFLVNNAGVFGGGAADRADLATWNRTIDVNLRSLMHLTRHALPAIEQQSRGAVVNIASVSGKQSHGGAADYCATKHAVVGFTGALFEDVRAHGVKVCAICPGFVNTDMVAGDRLVPERMIQPEDIARTVLFVLRFPDTGCPVEIVVRPQRSPYR